MPSLTTVDDLKTFLQIASSDTSEDTRLEELLDGVEWAVESFTKRRFASRSYTEYHDGNGRQLVVLRNRPVTAITSVKVDATGYYGNGTNAFAASTAWTIGTDYTPKNLTADEDNPGLLIALKGSMFDGRGVWPEGIGNIEVVYTAGYQTIPSDLILAVHQLASGVRQGAVKGGPIASETIGKYSYTLLAGNSGSAGGVSIADARSCVARYREVAF